MRKEVHLDENATIFWLQQAADKKKWSLKKYMEVILCNEATRIKKKYSTTEENNSKHYT